MRRSDLESFLGKKVEVYWRTALGKRKNVGILRKPNPPILDPLAVEEEFPEPLYHLRPTVRPYRGYYVIKPSSVITIEETK